MLFRSGCFALKLMERAPERVMAGVLVQTVGHHPEHPDYMFNSGRNVWASELLPRRPDLNLRQVERYFHDLYRVRPPSTMGTQAATGKCATRCWATR